MLLTGAKPVVESDNREVVTALREVANGKVYFVKPEDEASELSEESADQTEEESPEALKNKQ